MEKNPDLDLYKVRILEAQKITGPKDPDPEYCNKELKCKGRSTWRVAMTTRERIRLHLLLIILWKKYHGVVNFVQPVLREMLRGHLYGIFEKHCGFDWTFVQA